MPNSNSKSRQDLLSRFVRNAIPSETDFADLIKAGLNQADDGLVKLPNQPLGLVRQKPDQPVLRFYADPAAEGSAWQLQLGSGDKPGFGLAAADGRLALFVDGASGNVGIGTAAAAGARLTIQGDFNATKDPQSRLKYGGVLGIKSYAPTIDFIDTDIGNQWAIHVNESRMYFVREPWENEDLVLDGRGSIGMGCVDPQGKLNIRERTGTPASALQGTLLLDHEDAGGASSIVFRSKVNRGSDYAFIEFRDKNPAMPAEYIEAALLTIGVQNDGRDHIALMPSGNVGIGTTTPGSKLDVNGTVRCSSISGPANLIQKAHFSLKGGGLITWSKTNRLSWNRRFIAIGFGITNSSNQGYFDIGPTTGIPVVVEAHDGTNRVRDGSVELKDWESLYAILTGIAPNDVRLRIENYQQQGELSSNWLLIASRNGEDGSLKLGIGPSVSPGQSISYGSPIPCGTIVMWSGKPEDIPVGWFVCDGSNGTPDLRGRFILGSGKGSGLTLRDPQQPLGGREAIALGVNELPKHRHGITDPGHSHTWVLSRQRQGTDDENYTSEMSRGDAGAGDMLQVATNSVGTGIQINETGSGAAFDIMPPFYILIFIMKAFLPS
jgi:microcystin-dependent protein